MASPAVSRQIIGTEDAYHIESGREHRASGSWYPRRGRAGQIPQHLCRRHLRTTQGRPYFRGADGPGTQRPFTASAVDADQDVIYLPAPAGRAQRPPRN